VIQAANTRSASARLSGGQRMAVGGSVALGLGLAAYGVAGSYRAVSGLAQRKGVPLAHLVPVGIDGGLIGVVVLDLVLSWIGQPIGWLRQFVRVLTVGTVAANAAAGWPDLVSAGLRPRGDRRSTARGWSSPLPGDTLQKAPGERQPPHGPGLSPSSREMAPTLRATPRAWLALCRCA
jgi:hypothetical protein